MTLTKTKHPAWCENCAEFLDHDHVGRDHEISLSLSEPVSLDHEYYGTPQRANPCLNLCLFQRSEAPLPVVLVVTPKQPTGMELTLDEAIGLHKALTDILDAYGRPREERP